MTKCSNCGAEYPNAVPKFCSSCGKPMAQPQQQQTAQPVQPPQQPQQQAQPIQPPPQNTYGNQPGQTGVGAIPGQSFASQQGPRYNAPQNYDFKPAAGAQIESDPRSAVLGTGGFFLTTFLCSLPLIGFILTIVWGIGTSSTNFNRRNYCRSMMIMWLISIAVTVLTSVIVGIAVTPLLEELLAEIQQSGIIY